MAKKTTTARKPAKATPAAAKPAKVAKPTKAAPKAAAQASKPDAPAPAPAPAAKPTGTTIIAQMFAALTKTPKSMKELKAVAGTDANQYGQMGRLVAKGLVVKTEDGLYRLP